jgi:RNA polymerase sigma-70 factor (ECF subfamily)
MPPLRSLEMSSEIVRALYEQSGAGPLGLTFVRFAEVLSSIGALYLPADASRSETASFYRSLHIKDLTLAQACAEGSETAWECFLLQYRSKLSAASSEDLAGSLIGDLFERSKLVSYTGRGSLENWLKALLAQAYVDRYRVQSRFVSLDSCPAIRDLCTKDSPCENASDEQLEEAIKTALLELPPELRFILASYFLDGCTLAQIAKMLGVHESTVSRRIDKVMRSLRSAVKRDLRRQGLSSRAAEESMQTDVRRLSVDIRNQLARD